MTPPFYLTLYTFLLVLICAGAYGLYQLFIKHIIKDDCDKEDEKMEVIKEEYKRF